MYVFLTARQSSIDLSWSIQSPPGSALFIRRSAFGWDEGERESEKPLTSIATQSSFFQGNGGSTRRPNDVIDARATQSSWCKHVSFRLTSSWYRFDIQARAQRDLFSWLETNLDDDDGVDPLDSVWKLVMWFESNKKFKKKKSLRPSAGAFFFL